MDRKRVRLCGFDDLKEGELRQLNVEGRDFLLIRKDGKYFALSTFCPHYGAPLADGILSGERLICPWHHACFDIRDGSLLEPPASDPIESYDVSRDGDDIYLDLPASETDQTLSPSVTEQANNRQSLAVIVGAGAAGFAAATAMREAGFAGRVLMVTAEDQPPYDRPNLSKDYLAGRAEPEWIPLRNEGFYEANDIELILGERVNSIDLGNRKIALSSGDTLNFDQLLIATGCRPRVLDVPGVNLTGVHLLRTFADAEKLSEAANIVKNVVIIGGGFIGMEAAASLSERGLDVSVILKGEIPFERQFGPQIGRLFRLMHEEKGVKFITGNSVVSFSGEGRASAASLSGGDQVEGDLFLIGIGAEPVTEFIDGLDKDKHGAIIVDEYLRAADGIYVAGDIASLPGTAGASRRRVEHWRYSMQQGRIAGFNMAGLQRKFDAVPFFWTTQFGETLSYVGYAPDWQDVRIRGNLDSRQFLAYFVSDSRVIAVAGMHSDREVAFWEEIFRMGHNPDINEALANNPETLLAR